MAFDSTVTRRRQFSAQNDNTDSISFRGVKVHGLKECPLATSVESEEFIAEAELDR